MKFSFRLRKWLAIILPALFFGIAHWNLVQSTYAFLIGVLLDIIYFETRNLTNTFIIHATINSSSIIFEQTNANVGMGIMIACFVITIIYIIVLKNKNISLKEAVE